MTKDELIEITDFISQRIMRELSIAADVHVREAGRLIQSRSFDANKLITTYSAVDLLQVISYLHNELYKAITGDYYDYMWHWTNKCGCWVEDVRCIQACEYECEEVE